MNNPYITAAVFRDGLAEAQFETMDLAELQPDEVLVRLAATGICHSDLTCRDGFMALPRPIVLGHEGSGYVERVGSAVTEVVAGDAVVLSFYSCGKCANCRDGAPAYCDLFAPGNFSGRRLDGTTALHGADGDVSAHFFGQSSFATHSVTNERNVVKVRNDVPIELLGPLGCGVQTGAGSVMNLLKPQPGESMLVTGGGGVGLAAVMAAAVAGCDPIIVIEPNAARRELALKVGATHALDPAPAEPLAERIAQLAHGGIRNALDTTGIPDVISTVLAALGKRGKLVIVTTNAPQSLLAIPLIELFSRGISIRGTNNGDSVPREIIPKLVDLIADGRLPLHEIVKFYPFEELNQALEDQKSGAVVKPIVRF